MARRVLTKIEMEAVINSGGVVIVDKPGQGLQVYKTLSDIPSNIDDILLGDNYYPLIPNGIDAGQVRGFKVVDTTPNDGDVLTYESSDDTLVFSAPSGGGAIPGGSGSEIQIRAGASTLGAVAGSSVDSNGIITLNPTPRTSGVNPFLKFLTPADTTLTASAEAVGIQLGGNSSFATVTRQYATGALAQHRESLFIAPTIAFVAASTLTTAATVAITGPPIAGLNSTITNTHPLWLQSGTLRISNGSDYLTFGSNPDGAVTDTAEIKGFAGNMKLGLFNTYTDGGNFFTIHKPNDASKRIFFGFFDSGHNNRDPITIYETGDYRFRRGDYPGTDVLVLNSAGNVGIGTDPASGVLFHIAGSGSIQERFETTGVSNYVLQDYKTPSGSFYIGKERPSGGGLITGSLGDSGIVGTTNVAALQLATNDTVRLTIASGGNVGIGVLSPVGTLDVRRSSGEIARFALVVDDINTGYVQIGAANSTTTGLKLSYEGSTGNILYDSLFGGSSHIFKINGTTALTIPSSGAISMTSVALGGAAIGSNNFAVTGTSLFTGIIKASGTGTGVFSAINVLGGTSYDSGLQVGFNSTGTAGNSISLFGSATNGGAVKISTNFGTTDGPIEIGTFTNPSSLHISVAGNVGINVSAFGTSASKVFAIGGSTAPTSSPADVGGQIFSKDAAAGNANLFIINEAGETTRLTGRIKYVTTQFDKTSNTTLSTIGGMSHSVEASTRYSFVATLHVSTAGATGGGWQVAVGGSATATNIIYQVTSVNNGTPGLGTVGRATSLGSAITTTTASDASVYIEIVGTILVNAAGTLDVQFAQATSDSETSSVLIGSNFVIDQQ